MFPQVVMTMLAMSLVLLLGQQVESVSSLPSALYLSVKWLLLLDNGGLFDVSTEHFSLLAALSVLVDGLLCGTLCRPAAEWQVRTRLAQL